MRYALMALLFGAQAFAAPLQPPRKSKAPKLMVVVVIDQFRASDLERIGPHLSGGFKRLVDNGARLVGHYGQQNTYTGPGHASLIAGSYGYLNGVIQNKWFNRATNRSEGMLFDPESKSLDSASADPGEDTSPRNLNGSTVGD